MTSGLYLVATPIGNAADITLRALAVLRNADLIACEDTRVTARLLAIHGIERPLTAYHDHNAATKGPTLVARVAGGARVALVSDSGTPLISDPGFRLVQSCVEAGLPVIPVPGPSAIPTALAVSGLPTDRFYFAGFLPPRRAARQRAISDLVAIPATLVVLEAPHRLPAALSDFAEILGPRPAAVARELTKVFEEVRRGNLAELARHYAQVGPPRGEVTLVIASPEIAEPNQAQAERDLRSALEAGQSVKDATVRVAALTGVSRQRLYELAVALRSPLWCEDDDGDDEP